MCFMAHSEIRLNRQVTDTTDKSLTQQTSHWHNRQVTDSTASNTLSTSSQGNSDSQVVDFLIFLFTFSLKFSWFTQCQFHDTVTGSWWPNDKVFSTVNMWFFWTPSWHRPELSTTAPESEQLNTRQEQRQDKDCWVDSERKKHSTLQSEVFMLITKQAHAVHNCTSQQTTTFKAPQISTVSASGTTTQRKYGVSNIFLRILPRTTSLHPWHHYKHTQLNTCCAAMLTVTLINMVNISHVNKMSADRWSTFHA